MFTKKEKALMAIFLPLCVILFILYSLIVSYKETQKTVIVYPEGNLSDSLFVSQNNTYTESDRLPNKYGFETMPYYIDLPDGTVANVGNGSIVQINETSYLFISEYTSDKTAESVMLEEFPSALLIDFDSVYTYAQNLKTQAGYINGFAAQYYFNMLSVSNGNIVKTAYIAAYELRSIDTEEASPNRLLVGVITTKSDSVSFTNIKNYLDMVTLTVRYDKYLESEQNKKRKEAEEEGKAVQDNGSSTETKPADKPVEEVFSERTDELGSLPDADSRTTYDELVSDDDVDARVYPISIQKDYEDLFINIKTDVAVEDAKITLYTPYLAEITEKVVSEDGLTTQFQIGNVTKEQYGNYILKVTHYQEFGKVTAQVGDAQ